MTSATRPLLVGLGSPDRGDDAVGPTVARAVTGTGLSGVDVVEREDPTNLMDLWAGRLLVVVVDAVRSGASAGSIVVLETGNTGTPLTDTGWSATGRGGTHAFGLATAVELARALDRLPRRLVVVGVEAVSFEHGEPLSPPVAEAVVRAADVIGRLLEEVGTPATDAADLAAG